MKTILTAVLSLIAAGMLVACGKKEDVTTKQDAQNVPPVVTPAAPASSEPAKTEETKKQ